MPNEKLKTERKQLISWFNTNTPATASPGSKELPFEIRKIQSGNRTFVFTTQLDMQIQKLFPQADSWVTLRFQLFAALSRRSALPPLSPHTKQLVVARLPSPPLGPSAHPHASSSLGYLRHRSAPESPAPSSLGYFRHRSASRSPVSSSLGYLRLARPHLPSLLGSFPLPLGNLRLFPEHSRHGHAASLNGSSQPVDQTVAVRPTLPGSAFVNTAGSRYLCYSVCYLGATKVLGSNCICFCSMCHNTQLLITTFQIYVSAHGENTDRFELIYEEPSPQLTEKQRKDGHWLTGN
ncbi:uncharacterized protein LOC122551936 [Chiloscyllium plagiosum]|uniref:uncharacterized protein LOC122551936 n=1 Tax=Chiloscyllium plagiosum TaxID=36176 RepID=UPI001CB80E64|nr:uncharacterized protein LOC122551936 [Chiloscyllium plagiosum]